VKGNFFDRLAARTLGMAPVSQPILPAMFSPISKVTEPSTESALTSEAAEVPAAVRSQAEMPEASPSRTLPSSDGSRESSAENNSERRVPGTGNVALPEIGRTLPREQSSVPPPVPTATPNRLGSESPPKPAVRPAGESIAVAVRQEKPPHAPSTSQPVIAQEVVRGTAESRGQDSRHAVVRDFTRAGSLRRDSETAAPIVRVTIGRVEVRAQFPSAPAVPVARRPPPPALSLEDYLKQRSGGKR